MGETASAIKALSTVGAKSKSCASRTATTGITTNTDTTERTSRPGRRRRYDKSPVFVFRPKPTTVQYHAGL